MSALTLHLANYLAISKLQGELKLLNVQTNMRVTLHTLQFGQSTRESFNTALRLMYVGEQLRDARIAALCGVESLQGKQLQGKAISRPRGSSISLQGTRWLQGKSKRVERQTPPTAEIFRTVAADSCGSRGVIQAI